MRNLQLVAPRFRGFHGVNFSPVLLNQAVFELQQWIAPAAYFPGGHKNNIRLHGHSHLINAPGRDKLRLDMPFNASVDLLSGLLDLPLLKLD